MFKDQLHNVMRMLSPRGWVAARHRPDAWLTRRSQIQAKTGSAQRGGAALYDLRPRAGDVAAQGHIGTFTRQEAR